MAKTKPQSNWCPIGPLNLHTMNAERDECIWCGPNGLAWKPGKWVEMGNDTVAWTTAPDSTSTTTAK